MLTAWNGKNDFCAPFDRFCQRIISRCITGVQRHDHIDLIDALISGDVAVQEGQVLKSKLLAQAVAERNDIFFQIQTDDTDRIFLQNMKIIIHRKGQIRFSTSKINDRIRPVRIEIRKYILNKFQETVDLAKFVVAGFHNFAFCRHDTEIYQKWDWDAFLKDVFFSTVMG